MLPPHALRFPIPVVIDWMFSLLALKYNISTIHLRGITHWDQLVLPPYYLHLPALSTHHELKIGKPSWRRYQETSDPAEALRLAAREVQQAQQRVFLVHNRLYLFGTRGGHYDAQHWPPLASDLWPRTLLEEGCSGDHTCVARVHEEVYSKDGVVSL